MNELESIKQELIDSDIPGIWLRVALDIINRHMDQ